MGGASMNISNDLLPHTRCVLQIQGRDIQGHYASHIRRAAAQRTFRHYMQKRHAWTSGTYDDIDWESFYDATRNFAGNAIHLMKLVHDKLPTNLAKSRYSNHSSAQCHFCPHPDTFNHLCTSTCNERSLSFRHHLIQEMTEFLHENTPKAFSVTFLNALHIWLDSNVRASPHPWEGPPGLKHKQHTIGWTQMFRGYFTKEWRRYLQRTIKEHQVQKWLYENERRRSKTEVEKQEVYNPYAYGKLTSTYVSPVRILSKIIRKIWTLMGNLWRQHTSYLHDSQSSSSPLHRQELQAQIRAMHLLQDRTLAAHRETYFYRDMEQFLEHATNLQMRRYISRYRPVILRSVSQATKVATNSHLITMFFSRQSSIQSRPQVLHQAQEEPIHRKHTRRRIPLLRHITEYFHRIPTPSNANPDPPA